MKIGRKTIITAASAAVVAAAVIVLCVTLTGKTDREEADAPENMVIELHRMLFDRKWEDAEKICRDKGLEYVRDFREHVERSAASDSSVTAAAMRILKNTEIRITDEGKERNGTCIVSYELSGSDGTVRKRSAELVLDEGIWKIGKIRER